MQHAQVEKLYNKLTPVEQANLVVEAIARNDDDEMEVIVNSLEKRTYRIWNPEYTFRKEGLMTLALIYGVSYWKHRELFMRAMSACDKGNKEATFIFLQAAAQIRGMESALKTVCNEIKVDVDAIKTLADCKGEIDFGDNADPEIVAKYTELFINLVSL